MICNQCPRKCNIDRKQAKGFCNEGQNIRISKIIENFEWEEPCISGKKGTLAIFFSGCNLRCNFCQNYEISHIGKGQEYSKEEFLKLLRSFDYSKFDSVDFITPSQFSLQILATLREVEIPVPIVWNSNGYESEAVIEAISKYIDVFLVDFKFYDKGLSRTLSSADNYFEVASKVVKLMSELKPNKVADDLLKQGVVIRHLILPGQVKDSIKILDYIHNNIKDPIISLMSQFTPNGRGELNRKITPLEYKTVLAHAERLGLSNGYFQEFTSADTCFIPKF